MLKTIVIVIAVLIIGVLGFAATKPNIFHVERSITIKAPADKIFPLINDFTRSEEWSPFEKKDPTMKITLSGPKSGVGAVYEWNGNSEVGKGRMETIESTPSSKIVFKLDFLEPFEGHNTAEFTLKPEGDTTKVTWAMFGPNNYIGKLVSVFIDCDKIVGKDFEIGLANMKVIAEKPM